MPVWGCVNVEVAASLTTFKSNLRTVAVFGILFNPLKLHDLQDSAHLAEWISPHESLGTIGNIIEETQKSVEQLKLEQEPNFGHGGSSANPLPLPSLSPSPGSASSSSSSVYYSARSESMIENRSKFNTDLEFNIEYSRVHWSELAYTDHDVVDPVVNTDNDDDDDDAECSPEANLEHFERLKAHCGWGEFFRDFDSLMVDAKIGEGAQAEIYEATVAGQYQCVVKVFKEGYALRDLQRQWPEGMLKPQNGLLTLPKRMMGRIVYVGSSMQASASYPTTVLRQNSWKNYEERPSDERLKSKCLIGPLKCIFGGTLLNNERFNNRFAFVMKRKWGDLRKLIDIRMLKKKHGPPFSSRRTRLLMANIAQDMNDLHKKYGIIHRDLKASNVLVDCFNRNSSIIWLLNSATVADFECSMGVLGTGFWRAPEILQQLKNGIPSSKIRFSYKTDVYSFGMTCYEIVTGCIPFEDHSFTEYYDQVVLNGVRPELPHDLEPFLSTIISDCWKSDPFERPFFSDILDRFANAGIFIPY